MNIRDVEFVSSFKKESDCPKDGRLEFAFIGRSNVGKSSLINMLTNKKGLAKVSVTPGKTQLINFFVINDSWYLVDLPGYGYARTSKDTRQGFKPMIARYLADREKMVCAFVLIDSRHELQKIDREFLEWCGDNQVPFAIVYTKVDKLGKNKAISNIQSINKEILQFYATLPTYFITSSENRTGKEEVLGYIGKIMKDINNHDNAEDEIGFDDITTSNENHDIDVSYQSEAASDKSVDQSDDL